MKTEWNTDSFDFEQIILAGDIGGTNASIALVGRTGRDFKLIVKCLFKTDDLSDFPKCLELTLDEISSKDASLKPDICCISGAGPVENNYCKLSNSVCDIDGAQIQDRIGVKTHVINDFTAISYSLPLLDVNNPDQITPLKHIDGYLSKQSGTLRAVAGAGTGMGVGFLIENNGISITYPSEGGHIAFSSYDKESRQFHEYIASLKGELMEAELFVSGAGISRIFGFFKDIKKVPIEGVLAEIDKTNDSDKPELISQNADGNTVCRDIMRLFVKMYGRFAGDVASLLIPTMGMYLAGGIVTKNEKYFVDDDLFMKYFEDCYHPNVQRILKKLPVYIIKDYLVSLYGAANAAYSLMM